MTHVLKNINTDKYPTNINEQPPNIGESVNKTENVKQIHSNVPVPTKKEMEKYGPKKEIPIYNREPEPYINLQIYKQQDAQKKPEEPVLYPILSTNPYVPQQFTNPYQSVPQSYIHPQIIKKYNINITGPTADHSKVAMIYEDALPTKQFNNTMSTLGERILINDYIRSILIKYNDGDEISLNGDDKNSLLHRIKFLELNPFNVYKYSDNPYHGLSSNMLLYKSCYPINYDTNTASVYCARNSVGVNVRIYNLTNDAFNNRGTLNSMNYNVWRDIKYYSYIREEIIKKKICPHFVSIYTYYMCSNSNIDFNKIKMYLKNRTILRFQPQMNVNNNIPNKALIVLTESPNYNIYGWATRTYQATTNIKKMINTGFYNSDTWFSIIFQLLVALYVLQIKGILFNEFTIEEFVYIKDITTTGTIINHWKYKINGIDYYVPNYGYLVLIDNKFKDLVNDSSKKIISAEIFNDNDYDKTTMLKKTFEAFKNIINPNSFSKAFINDGGTKPPDDILKLLTSINNDALNSQKYDISYYILTYMNKYLNNKIGTYLSETEIPKILLKDVSDFIKGEIVIIEERYLSYKFAVYLNSNHQNKHNVLSRSDNNNDIQEMSIDIHHIYHYSKIEPIYQIFNKNIFNLNERELLEVYDIQ